jgi:hypothetical protein
VAHNYRGPDIGFEVGTSAEQTFDVIVMRMVGPHRKAFHAGLLFDPVFHMIVGRDLALRDRPSPWGEWAALTRGDTAAVWNS